MKKFFEYIGIIVLIVFSFIYTDKIVEMVNKNDPIMVSINNYAHENDRECIEGTITSDGIILGYSGIKVDVEESYRNMKGFGYDENKIEFQNDKCLINAASYIDEYIIKGNNKVKAVNIIILVNDGKFINRINSISKSQKINLSYAVTSSFFNDNKDVLIELYNEGNDIIFVGSDKDELNNYINSLSKIDKSSYKVCLEIGNSNILEDCSYYKLNTIRAKNIFNKNILLNTQKILDNGEIIIFYENNITFDELNATINYIKAKGYNIVSTKSLFM